MGNDLFDIFNEEALDYVRDLNEGLLKLELNDGNNHQVLLKEMNRIAHSLKGAARAVGVTRIEQVGEHMEEIFRSALDAQLVITPEIGDTLYDCLDLIQNQLADTPAEDDVFDHILDNLRAITTGQQRSDTGNAFQTDSTEHEVITDDMLAVDDQGSTPDSVSTSEQVSDELLGIFWEEVSEYLGKLNSALLNVEMLQGDERDEIMREMNRIAHSMKGAARAVAHEPIEVISHNMEDVFEQALEGDLDLTPHVADILYDGLDLITEFADHNPVSEEVFKTVLKQMIRIVHGTERAHRDEPLKAGSPVPPVEETPEMEIPAALMTTSIETVGASTQILRPAEDSIRVAVHKLDQMMANTSELITAKLQGENRSRMLRGIRRDHTRLQHEWRSARSAYIRLARRMQDHPEGISSELGAIFRFLENNEDYLSRMNRELARLQQTVVQDNLQLGALADQLQDDVSNLRMMPFETIVGGFQRVARDVARDVGKKLHLEIRGVSVEVDKTVLDALKDPLMHLLRNAIDHGLETPDVRARLGKAPVGYVMIIAEQRGAELAIVVKDDGRGLDLDLIKRKAVARKLLSTQEARALPDDDAQMLVFQSGLTTSENVTALSGRGLGMDIVRNRVESLRGRIAIDSLAGKGTTITLQVPVSLTRLSVVTVRVGDEHYAVPSNMIERMATVRVEEIFTAEGNEMLNINGRPVPLVSLGSILKTPIIDERGHEIKLIALSTPERTVAFEVDELFTEVELVLKPLGRELVNAPFVAGASLLGSGEVIIVLDVNDLVRQAVGTTLTPHQRPMVRTQEIDARPLRILVVDDSITTRTLEKNILEAIGFEVHVAIDGAEAWQRIPEIAPDVIVSDVEMPKMNGLELTRLLKSTQQTRDIPIILLTSLAKPEQREAGLSAGADAYLVKSRFDQNELLETINSVI